MMLKNDRSTQVNTFRINCFTKNLLQLKQKNRWNNEKKKEKRMKEKENKRKEIQ